MTEPKSAENEGPDEYGVRGFFQKKPVVIEAKRLTDKDRLVTVSVWLDLNLVDYSIDLDEPWSIGINTLEGVMRADIGDWIIKGVKGEFYPCKDDIFRATYTPHNGSLTNGEGN